MQLSQAAGNWLSGDKAGCQAGQGAAGPQPMCGPTTLPVNLTHKSPLLVQQFTAGEGHLLQMVLVHTRDVFVLSYSLASSMCMCVDVSITYTVSCLLVLFAVVMVFSAVVMLQLTSASTTLWLTVANALFFVTCFIIVISCWPGFAECHLSVCQCLQCSVLDELLGSVTFGYWVFDST